MVTSLCFLWLRNHMAMMMNQPILGYKYYQTVWEIVTFQPCIGCFLSKNGCEHIFSSRICQLWFPFFIENTFFKSIVNTFVCLICLTMCGLFHWAYSTHTFLPWFIKCIKDKQNFIYDVATSTCFLWWRNQMAIMKKEPILGHKYYQIVWEIVTCQWCTGCCLCKNWCEYIFSSRICQSWFPFS